jgi:translocation and assembly module TamB
VGTLVVRALGVTLRVVASVVVLAVMLVASLLVHLDTPVVRRVAVARVNQLVFHSLFRGEVAIVALGHVDPFGVSGASFRVMDPMGNQVLLAEGIEGRFSTLALLESVVGSPRDLVVDVPSITIRNVDVRLDMDDTGMGLANAFFPLHPSTEPSQPADGHGVHVYAPHVHIGHAWAHGQILRAPYLDGDITGLDAAFALLPTALSVEARRGSVAARGIALGADAKGAFEGAFGLTLDPAHAMSGRVRWDGTTGSLPETAKAKLEKDHFDATLDLSDASPDAVRSLWPGSPMTVIGSAHVEAHGPLTAIDVALHASLDTATLDAHGDVAWGAEKHLRVHVDADEIDIRQFATSAAPSSLGVKGDAHAGLAEDGTVSGGVDLDFRAGYVGSMHTPRVTLRGSASRAPTGGFGGDATFVIDEPGAPTTVTLHGTPTQHSSRVDLDVASHDVHLGALTRRTADLKGSAYVIGKGSIDLDDLAVDASIEGRGTSFAHGPLQVGAATLTGRASGRLADPRIDLELHARGLRWRTTTVSVVDIAVHGPALSPHVALHEQSPDMPTIDATVDVDLKGGPAMRNADVCLRRKGESARVRAARVRVTSDEIAVDGAVIDGLGETAVASFDRTGSTMRLRAKAPQLDVARIARLAGVDEVVRGGTLSIDTDVSLEPGRASGRAHIALDGGIVATIHGVSAHIDGELRDRRFVGTAAARAGDLGSVDIDAKRLGVGGTGPLVRASWKKVFGDVLLKGHVDLATLAKDFPATFEVGSMHGAVDLDGRLERDSASDFTPTIDVTAGTTGLYLQGKPAPAEGSSARAAPWRLQGVDATTTVHVNGDTGFLQLTARVRDGLGDMAVIGAESSAIPYQELYANPKRAFALLAKVPFDAHVAIPAQSIANWPDGIVRLPVDGTLKADLAVKGPLSSPRVKLTAKLTDVTGASTRLTSPIELDLDAAYDGERADATLHGVHHTREVLTAEAHTRVSAADLVAGRAEPPWTASGKAHIDELPLGIIGPLDDRQIRGHLNGDVVLTDLHEDAKVRASLRVNELKVGEASYPDARLTFMADGKTIDAEARFEQDDGSGTLKARLGAGWGASLLPTPDPQRPLDVTFVAKHFRAAALLPFVQGSVDELDGVVDGSAEATVDPRTKAVHVQGSLALKNGLFELASFGGELHDVAGKLTVTPGGALTVEGFTASGVSGQVLAAASARLNGLRLEGASATIQIPKSRPFPLYISGALLGSIDGKLDVTEQLSADGHTLAVKVDIPTLHLVVPARASQDVQALGPIPGVRIGTRGAGSTFVVEPTEEADNTSSYKERPADAVRVRIETHLGSDVSIRRGGDLRVELTGGPVVTIADTTQVSGQIQLHGGVLNLYGKTFDIETGTVTFVGDDASNPQVRVTAGWTASDGTLVNADFIGPLKTGKVTLRSQPPLSRNDIVQLLLFGTTDGQVANAGAAPGTYSAGGVAGNVATQPLNRALDQFGLSAVSAKVDTSSANAKPEIEVQLAKNISVQLAQVLYVGNPPPGTAPDKTLLTVDWRFLRKWSLEATVGNAGSTIVDLIWQYRY